MYEGDTDLCMALVSTDNIHWEIAITYLVPLHENRQLAWMPARVKPHWGCL